MRTFDVQSIAIAAPRARVFDYIANPANLPRWTNPFKQADQNAARMETPQGVVSLGLKTVAQAEVGTIDWIMTFPDGAVATAYSRVTPDGESSCVYSFVLMAPPGPLEALEGALDEQRKILADELPRLKAILEAA